MSIQNAARYGDVSALREILRKEGQRLSVRDKVQAIDEAIQNNRLDALQFLWRQCTSSLPKDACHTIACKMLHAARHKRHDLIAVMINDRAFMTSLLHMDKKTWFRILATNARVNLFKTFLNMIPMANQDYIVTCYQAAGDGENHVVRMLLENKGNKILAEDKAFALTLAGKNGHLNIVRYIAESQQLSKAHFNISVCDICLIQHLSPAHMQVIRYLFSTHKRKMLEQYLIRIYAKANDEVRAIIAENFAETDYNPSLLRRIFKLGSEIDRECIENDNIKTWRNVKYSTINSLATLIGGLLMGLAIPMLSLVVGGVFALSMTSLWIRNYIKTTCAVSYLHKSADEIEALSPAIKSAFHEGCLATQSYLYQTGACLPTSNAFWHPKAFYAGYEAMTLSQDYASIGKEKKQCNIDQLIRKIVPR